ncbi:hypothetical protein ACVCAH_35335, partial [Micromonospora sp. LZ34]
MSAAIGAAMDRVDGRAKVRGEARYSAEIAMPGLAHAVLVGAWVPSGRITRIDASEAERADGVLAVLSHLNLPSTAAAIGGLTSRDAVGACEVDAAACR